MKKLRMFALLIATVAIGFTSCQKDDETEPVDQSPTITFATTGDITGDEELETGEEFTVTVNAFSNSDSKKDLTSFVLIRQNGSETIYYTDSVDLPKSSFSENIKLTASTTAGTEKFVFKVTDKAGETAQIEFTITTTEPVVIGELNNYGSVTIGAQSSSEGSFYASSTNTVYSSSDYADNTASIDMILGYDATIGLFIGAPNDADINTTFPTNMANFTVKNATKFTSALSADDYLDFLDDKNHLETIIANATNSKISAPVTNQVFGFVTESGKKGVVLITGVNGNTASADVSIKVSVEK